MNLKRVLVILTIIWIGCARLAAADGVFIEPGTGWNNSRDSNALFLRYQKDTSRLFRQESFYDFVLGDWSGKNRNQVVSAARGLRFPFFHDRNYFSLELGLSYVKNITDNLGTHFQFLSRFAFAQRIGKFEFAIGYIHCSNGKVIFQWHGPNRSDNFLTVNIGYLF